MTEFERFLTSVNDFQSALYRAGANHKPRVVMDAEDWDRVRSLYPSDFPVLSPGGGEFMLAGVTFVRGEI